MGAKRQDYVHVDLIDRAIVPISVSIRLSNGVSVSQTEQD